ncbi:hypothetical protein KP509_17G083700 [Ceratopteris richardii]|uniref:Large ribosomal subunit protein bL25 beta domain-containing protein n=1 Tax=Ceratopteris richardii TaxID=49495 RepID=A0A8T2SZM5_CERRI|nr:hypothetical protein KP509_17G083700 [Ceratopteris richardii]
MLLGKLLRYRLFSSRAQRHFEGALASGNSIAQGPCVQEPQYDPSVRAVSDGAHGPSMHIESSGDSSTNSEIITLWGSYRVRSGELQALRKNGTVPGIISDFDAVKGTQYNYYIVLKRQEIWGLVTQMGRQKFMSRFYNLALRNCPESNEIQEVVKVYPRKLYLLDGKRTILNLAFVRVRCNVKLQMIIPLKFKGRTVCPGLINGGKLVVLKKAISCLVFPDEVPPYYEVDVSKLNVGDRILMNDLNVHLRSRRQAGYVVCEIKKHGFVRPNRSRSLARASPSIHSLLGSW